jgi:hypothetical protein
MIEVQDNRARGWCWIDHAVIDNYGARIGPYGLALYMALARHANSDRTCWPSYETLAGELGMSRRKVIEVAKDLKEMGLIEVSGRKTIAEDGSITYRSNVFILCRVQDAHLPSEHGALGGAQHSPPLVHSMHQKYIQENKKQEEGEIAPAPPADRSISPVPKEKQARRAAEATTLPADFAVTDSMLGWARGQGFPDMTIARETSKFRASASAHGRKYS